MCRLCCNVATRQTAHSATSAPVHADDADLLQEEFRVAARENCAAASV
jgi:hypothetical protein